MLNVAADAAPAARSSMDDVIDRYKQDVDLTLIRDMLRRPAAERVDAVIFGRSCRCLDLDTLIRVKRAAGRVKDFEAIAELELIRDELRKRGP